MKKRTITLFTFCKKSVIIKPKTRSAKMGGEKSIRRSVGGGVDMDNSFEYERRCDDVGADDLRMLCDRIHCSERFLPERSFSQLERSELIEINIVTEGSGVHCIFGRAIPCSAGDVYVLRPNVSHGYFVFDAQDTLSVRRLRFGVDDWLSGKFSKASNLRFCYGVFGDNAQVAYAVLNSETREMLHSVCASIESELDMKKEEWRASVSAYLSILLITIGRYVNRAIKNIPSLPPKEWRSVCAVLQTVSERYGDSRLTLESIANELYISQSQLSRIFKKAMGVSFSQHIKSVRLEHACELLLKGDVKIEEIVRLCGLRDVPTFYHSFRTYKNVTPSRYRALHNKKSNNKPKGEKIMIILGEISENLQKGKAKIVKEMVQQAIDEGCAPADILSEGLLHGMSIIGEKFKNNEVYVPEVLVAARAMNMGMQILKPHLAQSGEKAKGKVCIGTVQGDLHDIGKNLVRMMLEGKGLEVVDLGVDVPAEKFVQTAIENECQVICCSALLTTTMNVMADVVKAAEAAGVRDKIKIMVGGAPVSREYCEMIGADCYTTDAASAADAAVELCKR